MFYVHPSDSSFDKYFINIMTGQCFVKMYHGVTAFNTLPCCCRSINCIYKIKGSLRLPHTAVRINSFVSERCPRCDPLDDILVLAGLKKSFLQAGR